MSDLQDRPTELEVAELVAACQKVLTPTGMMVLRRVLFERDRLLASNTSLLSACEELLRILGRTEILRLMIAKEVEAAVEAHGIVVKARGESV